MVALHTVTIRLAEFDIKKADTKDATISMAPKSIRIFNADLMWFSDCIDELFFCEETLLSDCFMRDEYLGNHPAGSIFPQAQ